MGVHVYENSCSDLLIHARVMVMAEVSLPHGEKLRTTKVKGHRSSHNGQVLEEYNSNPTLILIIYDILFHGGSVKQYAANAIVESLYSTLDNEGHSKAVFDSILEYAKDNRIIDNANKYIKNNKGNIRLCKTAIRLSVLIRYKNQSESWAPFKLMKENYPVKSSEYAKCNCIENEPAIQRCIQYSLKKQDVILSTVKPENTISISNMASKFLSQVMKLKD